MLEKSDTVWLVSWASSVMDEAGIDTTDRTSRLAATEFLKEEARACILFCGRMYPDEVLKALDLQREIDSIDGAEVSPQEAITFVDSHCPGFAEDIKRVLTSRGAQERLVWMLQQRDPNAPPAPDQDQQKMNDLTEKILRSFMGTYTEQQREAFLDELLTAVKSAEQGGNGRAVARSQAFLSRLYYQLPIPPEKKWGFGKLVASVLFFEKRWYL